MEMANWSSSFAEELSVEIKDLIIPETTPTPITRAQYCGFRIKLKSTSHTRQTYLLRSQRRNTEVASFLGKLATLPILRDIVQWQRELDWRSDCKSLSRHMGQLVVSSHMHVASCALCPCSNISKEVVMDHAGRLSR